MGSIVRALVVEDPDLSLDRWLNEGGVEVHRVSGAPDEAELIKLLALHNSQVVFKRSRTEVTRQVIEQTPGLLRVQLCCIGDDSVDKQACGDDGVLVFNDPVPSIRVVVKKHVSSCFKRKNPARLPGPGSQ
jgi:D-3-phosphoglycerate dehydrogenase